MAALERNKPLPPDVRWVHSITSPRVNEFSPFALRSRMLAIEPTLPRNTYLTTTWTTAVMINRYLRHLTVLLSFLVATISCNGFADASTGAEGKPQAGLPTISLKVGSQAVRAEIANTEASRQVGMMYRKKMAPQDGMLFIFPEVGYHAMWMRNTFIPLSVAYMDERGAILSIHEMQPLSDIAHQSAGPARFALEMNAGWFSTHKIKAGDAVKGLE
ncbi:MAG: DUF192 domain-containing protein, partial [Usitatibacteraceae bacterium]